MKKILFFLAVFIFVVTVLSERVFAFEFPIAKLGNCRDTKECRLYCEVPTHKAACWSYGVYVNKTNVLADEDPAQPLAPFGITFPVAELGGCTDVSSCKTYCDNPVNRDACQAFHQARKTTIQQNLQSKAQEELGCASAEECRTFCAAEVNREVCTTFARKYHLKTPVKRHLLEEAKEKLSCADEASCRQACALTQNKTRCETLAQKFNIKNTRREELIEQAREKLGCTSFETCRTFCQNQENQDKCRNFGAALTERIQQKLMEKGNCASIAECRAYCEEHPSQCPGFPKTKVNVEQLLRSNRGPGSLNSGPSSRSGESRNGFNLPSNRGESLKLKQKVENDRRVKTELEVEEEDDDETESTNSGSDSNADSL